MKMPPWLKPGRQGKFRGATQSLRGCDDGDGDAANVQMPGMASL
jgi:hypothetical protein